MRLNFDMPKINFATMGSVRQRVQQNILAPKMNTGTIVRMSNGSLPPKGHVNPFDTSILREGLDIKV